MRNHGRRSARSAKSSPLQPNGLVWFQPSSEEGRRGSAARASSGTLSASQAAGNQQVDKGNPLRTIRLKDVDCIQSILSINETLLGATIPANAETLSNTSTSLTRCS